MPESCPAVVEQSEQFIQCLTQRRADVERETMTVADVVGDLAIPVSTDNSGVGQTRLLIIAGGAASGKSTLAEGIAQGLAEQDTTSALISTDDFVRWDRQERHVREADGMLPEEKYNFFELRRVIGAICTNQDADQTVEVPQYDPHTGLAIDGEQRRRIGKVNVLIAEGDMFGRMGMIPQDLYPLYGRSLEPWTLYLHVPDMVRLARRVERDMVKRNAQGATPDDIVRSFAHRQVTQHLPYTLEYAVDADVILTPPAEKAGRNPEAFDMYRTGRQF